ncbi:restriction endonuclease subunit S [Runella zeae]|uniref:restriction endonuclease subunit S n=1 Tax=Runella zeae TaxID=94255 RepID=UPI002356869D|nr:restriction endonuclease subunit S [Runella zeae]
MNLVPVSEIFEVQYGNSFELNSLKQVDKGINFVSRTAKNNGVSAKVKRITNVEPFPAGTITVSLGGSVLETFVQPEQFYTGYHIYCLTPRNKMSLEVKLFYCTCITANKYRYNYGRQANRTLKDLLIPDLQSVPKFVKNADLNKFDGLDKPLIEKKIDLNIQNWKWFVYEDLFDIERGRGPRKNELDGTGDTPFVTSSDQNNGWTDYTTTTPIHKGNTIGVNRNGSVAEAFYQPLPFCSTEDVHIFTPKFKMSKYVALFLATLIKKEKYRYNYGRKWGIARMKTSTIKLPVDKSGQPDWKFMEEYIKTINYSKQI